MPRMCVFTFTPDGDGGPESISTAHRAVVSAAPPETFSAHKGGHAAVGGSRYWQQHGVLRWGRMATVHHWRTSKGRFQSRASSEATISLLYLHRRLCLCVGRRVLFHFGPDIPAGSCIQSYQEGLCTALRLCTHLRSCTHPHLHRQRHTKASQCWSLVWSRVPLKLTLTVGSIVGDEDGHVVGRAVAAQAGTVVAAVRVVADGALTADLISLYLTFIFIYKTFSINRKIITILYLY